MAVPLFFACGARSAHGSNRYDRELRAEGRAAEHSPRREERPALLALRPARPTQIIHGGMVEGEEVIFRSMHRCGSGPVEVELDVPAGSARALEIEAITTRGMPIRVRAYLNDTLVASGQGSSSRDVDEHENCSLEAYRTGRRVRVPLPENGLTPVGDAASAGADQNLGTEELSAAPPPTEDSATRRLPIQIQNREALDAGGRLRVVLFSETPIDWSGAHFRLATSVYEVNWEVTRAEYAANLATWRARVERWEARLAESGLSEAQLREMHRRRNEELHREDAEQLQRRVAAFDRLWESCPGYECRRSAFRRSCNLWSTQNIRDLPSCSARRESLRRPANETPRVQRAPTEPPPLRAEHPGVQPSSGARWVEGTWVWSGEAYEWLSGVWQVPEAQAVVVALPPPASRAAAGSATPPAPTSLAGSIWVGGHWRLSAGAYRWIRGEWKRPPNEGARWRAPRIEVHLTGSLFTPGGWN